ncbi:hypothetical protein [Candidatus Protochlamydia phocaeensis]|uniref:hypothetical protein n=1 Tax=Candidatus Protochlamydia phocaeensis TaxID=1414722 RepID=UPI000837CA28|nr:hypothetical protein [Candidatus Protochlamydia phocaeensis]
MTGKQEGIFMENWKELNEWALAAGRVFKSPQTGYIHYHHSNSLSLVHQTIPLYENALFILALLKSRLVDNIQEAKGLLNRILYFQCQEGEAAGNFPFYLHDFPNCFEPEQGVQLLAPFYWILKLFGHVLGHELKNRMEKSLSQLIEFALRAHQAKAFPYSLSVRLSAGLIACGILLKNEEWREKGHQAWLEMAQSCDSWYATAHIADILIAFQMAEETLNGAWAFFGKFLRQTWHKQACCYIGPCVRELQEQEEPQVNLYDFFLGYLYGRFPQRAKKIGIAHLQASLIQPFSFHLEELELPYQIEGTYKKQKWMLSCRSTRAYTLLEKKEKAGPSLDKTYTPFRLVWGNELHAHTLVCQGGKYERMEFKLGSDELQTAQESVELFFDFEQDFNYEGKEQRDICFYFDFHPDARIQIKEQASTTFELGQPITLRLNEQQLSLTFSLVQGEGDFLGHLARGNRPSQIKSKEEKSFQTYDWVVFLRTIRRHSVCRLKAILQFS